MTTIIKKETLSKHETEATFKGKVTDKHMLWKSKADNSRYPPTTYYEFSINKYIKHEKLGKFICLFVLNWSLLGRFGDDEVETISFIEKEQESKFLSILASLKIKDKVSLSWNHDYVTEEEEGILSTFPRRVITLLKK